MKPVFARTPSGALSLGDTAEAKRVKSESSRTKRLAPCLPEQEVRKRALGRCGKSPSEQDLLGQFEVQFGIFKGQTFKWLVENSLGYSAWLVYNMQGEKPTEAPLSKNKFAFQKYFLSFPEGREALVQKKSERKESNQGALSSTFVRRPGISAQVKLGTAKGMVASPHLQGTPSQGPSCVDIPDEALVAAVEAVEKEKQDTSIISVTSKETICLPEGWKRTLPTLDHKWVSGALFKESTKGQPELDPSKLNKLWWYPPQPSLAYNQKPELSRYFGHRLLLWMPRRFFRVILRCRHPECQGEELTSAGIYPRVRRVLDIDTFYSLASEYLECPKCKRKVISWSKSILDQLDIGHRLQFPVFLTYRYACDVRVVRLLRERRQGNSSYQLHHKLMEQHSEVHLQHCAHYLTHCKAFSDAMKKLKVNVTKMRPPPAAATLPKPAWLLTVHAKDVLTRLEDLKSQITSTFGTILKMDSTKKIVRKLAGHGAGTASWASNIGNEYGQVLMSVLTAGEGHGLKRMCQGVVKRYQRAGVDPPKLLYVDRDCCSHVTQELFAGWDSLVVRLDIWHFMRRIAAACTTEAHQLYEVFLGRLSQCIFEWSAEDVSSLKAAKRAEMMQLGIDSLSDADVMKRITKRELALHCRRRTRGADTTVALITELLEAFSGSQGCDTLGLPLLDADRASVIWESQKRHVTCLQDPPDVQLYTQVGSLLKGGKELPVLRSGRGSSSLESFHLHLNRFIPGTSANDVHFQAYLVEGLARWNQDRSRDATVEGKGAVHSYDSLLSVAVNNLSTDVLGFKHDETFVEPRAYTGELIGVEYLLAQTGKALTDTVDDSDSDVEEVLDQEDEGVQDVDTFNDLTLAFPMEGVHVQVNTSAVDKNEDAVGPDNVPGFAAVCALSSFLVGLKDHTGPISNKAAENIVLLWDALSPFDKLAVKFPTRHKSRLVQGRFKASKITSDVSGVDSTKRCFFGKNTGPASWPDCNRYMEQIIVQLCSLHPSHVTVEGRRIPRWTLVTRAYQHIRNLVLNNPIVMDKTRLQLVEINNTTLNQWYIRRYKDQERQVLQQGITVTKPRLVAETELPEPKSKPKSLEVGTATPHVFTLPPLTVGKGKAKPLRIPDLPAQPVPVVPKSTLSYRKRVQERADAGQYTKRYKKRDGPNHCRRCGEPRGSTHLQYYGNWYCPNTMTVSAEQWKEELKIKRQEGKQN